MGDFKKICRICMEKDRNGKFSAIFSDEENNRTASDIFLICGVEVIEYPSCPALICPKCSADLSKAVIFRDRCKNTDKIIRESFASHSSKRTTDEIPITFIKREKSPDESDTYFECPSFNNDTFIDENSSTDDDASPDYSDEPIRNKRKRKNIKRNEGKKSATEETPQTKKRQLSNVWEFARKHKNLVTKEIEGECLKCGKLIKCSSGSITSLKSHLRSKHDIDLTRNSKISSPPLQVPRVIQDEKKPAVTLKNTLKEIVTDMVTDGISIKAITKNPYIKESLKRNGFKLPDSADKVMELVYQDYDDKRFHMTNEIKELMDKGTKMSLIINQYVTEKQRRYLGINLHDYKMQKTYKLGLIRLNGMSSTESTTESIKKHLSLFNINLEKEIVGFTQNTSVVNRFISISSVIQQFCLNEAIQHGVCDALYKKNLHEEEYDSEKSDDENDQYNEAFDFELINDSEDLVIDCHQILRNAKTIVDFIKSSAARNKIFKFKAIRKYDEEVDLIADVKNRWDMIPSMLEPIIQTKDVIYEIFKEANSLDIFNSIDFEEFTMLQKSIEPIKLAVDTLNREDSTLLMAETVIDFMMKKLKGLKSDISNLLLSSIQKRIEEQRNDEVMNLLKCLKDHSTSPSQHTLNFAGNLYSRLFGISNKNKSKPVKEVKQKPSSSCSLQEELDFLLKKNENPQLVASQSSAHENYDWLKNEFSVFKSTEIRTEKLQQLYDALLSIKPTVDTTNVFYISSNCSTKIKSRLSDKSLNILMFLKFYYNKKIENNKS